MKESLKLKGFCRILVKDKHLNIIDIIEDSNLIVDGTFAPPTYDRIGKQGLIELIAGETGIGPIKKMGIGDRGAPVGNPFNPTPPTADKTSLNRLLTNPISPAENPREITTINIIEHGVTFSTDFTSDEFQASSFYDANSKVVNEAGLFFETNNQLCAMRTFNSIPFDPTNHVTVTFQWNIVIV